MHQIIAAIVYAKNEEDGIMEAEGVFEQLTVNQDPFDYYCTFAADDENSGHARWGNSYKEITLANSTEGNELITRLMEYTESEFMGHIEQLRKHLDMFSNQALFCNEYLKKSGTDEMIMFKYRARSVGSNSGPNIFLYDTDGSGICDPANLRSALAKHSDLYKNEKNPYENDQVWVVPADVHF